MDTFKRFLINPMLAGSSKFFVSSSDASADLALLSFALEIAYPGRHAMNSEDWNRIIESIANLAFSDRVEISEFGETVAELLWPIPDGHLVVKLGEFEFGASRRLNLRAATTGENIAGTAIWKIEMHAAANRVVPVIAISRFPQTSDVQWKGFLEGVRNAMAFPEIIFDLRGNAGGDDSKAIEAASILLGQSLPLSWVNEIVCETAAAYALQANTYSAIIFSQYYAKNLKAPLPVLEKHQQALELAERIDSGIPILEKMSREEPAHTATSFAGCGYKGRIFVLTDSQTASSGEWATLYLKRLNRCQIVGESTFGMIHFGNSGLLRLSHSEIEITLCMKINELLDGRFYEKTGIPPDTLVSNQNSLEYTLANLITN